MSKSPLALPADYVDWLNALKQRIRSARQRALLAANEEQIRLYHDIGREILDRQSRQGWGAKVIDHLSADLRDAFPDMKGFSSRNLKYMTVFARECPDFLIGQQSAAQLPWFHIVTILTKLADDEFFNDLLFYHHRSAALPHPEPARRRVCPLRHRQADRRCRIPARPRPTNAARHQSSQHRRDRGGTLPRSGTGRAAMSDFAEEIEGDCNPDAPAGGDA